MTSVPAYVPIVFILTTLATVAFLFLAIRPGGAKTLPSGILLISLPIWLLLQAGLAISGFYLHLHSLPPRILIFGVLPAVTLIIVYFLLFRSSFVEKMPLRTLTLLHTSRIPVEIVLFWLFLGGQVPEVMTFEGRNLDILSGLLAPVAYLAAFRPGRTRWWVLIAYNILGLVLLVNIVSIAIMSLPTPLQQLALDKPNRAVLIFPYIWLPTIVVPIVLFSHLAALWKLVKGHTVSTTVIC